MQETLRQAKVVGSRIVRIGQQGHSVPLEVSQIILSRILRIHCTLSGAELSIMSEVAHRATEKITCGAPTMRILFCEQLDRLGHRMLTVIEMNGVFSTGSRPALMTMGLPDRGWSVGSTKSEQLHDVKSVTTGTFAMCQTVESLYANLILRVTTYNSRPTGPHQENVFVDNTPNHWQTSTTR